LDVRYGGLAWVSLRAKQTRDGEGRNKGGLDGYVQCDGWSEEHKALDRAAGVLTALTSEVLRGDRPAGCGSGRSRTGISME